MIRSHWEAVENKNGEMYLAEAVVNLEHQREDLSVGLLRNPYSCQRVYLRHMIAHL